jgi:hypothetical protein
VIDEINLLACITDGPMLLRICFASHYLRLAREHSRSSYRNDSRRRESLRVKGTRDNNADAMLSRKAAQLTGHARRKAATHACGSNSRNS